MDYGVRDRVAIVTAGSRGIGRGIVDLLLEQGAKVAVCARHRTQLEALQREHLEKFLVESVDLEKSDDISSFIQRVASVWGGIDLLFYNAPVPVRGTVGQLTPGDWDRTYAGLVKGLVVACQAVVPHMRKKKEGAILVLSSIAAVEPIDWLASSSVLRRGLSAWVKLMAKEYGRDGIRINGVLPGYVQTDLLKAAAEETARDEKTSIEDVYKKWSAMIPLGRIGEPRDIAHAALFLVSPHASYISGTTLLVDGGCAHGL